MDSRQDDSRNDSSRQNIQSQFNNYSPYTSKNYQIQIQALQDELFTKNDKLINCQREIHELSEENQQMTDAIEKLTQEN